MISTAKKKSAKSVLGLTLEGNCIRGVWLKRSNGTAHIVKRFVFELGVDPLKDEPELAGRDIRKKLDEAGVTERRCVVCLPPEWVLFNQSRLPDLPEEDIRSFLALEAERSFPFGPDALFLDASRVELNGAGKFAGQAAIQRDNILRLEQSLRASRLLPSSFSIALPNLQNPADANSDGVVALFPGSKTVQLQVAAGGGIAALRSLENSIESEGATRRYLQENIAREIRVTLGQLPEPIRSRLRVLRLIGKGNEIEALARELRTKVETLGLSVEVINRLPGDLGVKLPPDIEANPAIALAARHLAGKNPPFEFLPPKISVWQGLAQKYSARKLAWAGMAAGIVATMVGISFIWQQWQLSTLESRWARMRTEVSQLEHVQEQIRRFRPWFDDSFRTLDILSKLTLAFPENGSVTAKTLEMRGGSVVVCSGIAQDQQAFLKVLDLLRATEEFGNVTLEQVRGQNPIQFTFNFQWGGNHRAD